ncbi:membrane-spanning 4-domains subfamily A member 4A-like [Cetorhinus maximus]
MAYFSKNERNVYAQNQLPPQQLLPSCPEVNRPVNQTMVTTLTQNNAGVQEMLKGKLKALGISGIVTGIIVVLIGIVKISVDSNQYFIRELSFGTPFWTRVPFIIAGSLTVAVEKDPTHGMIRGCLSMNIISAISCFPATIIYSFSLAFPENINHKVSCLDIDGSIACLALLLLLALLNAAISISVSSFNCNAMVCCGTPVPVIVVYNNASEQLMPSQQFHANPVRY